MASAASPIANRNRATDATSPSVGVVDIASPLKAHVEATLVTSPMKMRKSAIPTLDSAPSPQHTGSIPSVSIVASIAAITSAAESDGQWRYAYEQVRRLLPHSESVAPWQQHAFALLSCAEIAMRLGEPADACGFASDAVALHVAVSCDAASVMARLTAAKAFEKSGRRMESRDMYRSACTIVEKGIASAEQTFHSSTVVVPLDAALPFVEFANFLSNCGSDESRVDLLKQALKQCPTTKRTLCQAHLLLARASVAESELTEADAHYERAVTTAANDDQLCDVLAEASQFAQHKLRSIEKAVTYYNRLFDVRPPEVNACAHRGELLLNAGVCFEQHPSHGSARAVGLYRLAIANFPPKSPNTHRMRLYLARAYGGSGQVDRAVEEYSSLIHDMSAIRDEVMQIDVNGVRGFLPLCEVFGHLALCLFQRAGDLQGAAVQYQQTFEASESRRPAPPARTLEWLHEGCGALYLRMGHYQEALQHLEEKIELASRRNDPAVDAHLHAAAAYESLRKPEAAMDVYKYLFDLPITASTREHRLEVTLRFAWLCHYTLADFEAAVTLYLAALHIDADNPHTMVQAAWCMLQLPQHDQAEIEALYSSAALAVETAKHGQVTGQWDECYVLGECAVFHHDVTKKAALAEELYTAALACKTSENFAQVAANFAVFLHYERKETARAMTWFESAIASNPHLPAATTLFADFLIHTNQLDRAVEELQKLLPTNRAEAWHKLGRIAERVVVQDSYDTAIAAYCKALGAPDDETVMTDEAVLSYISKVEASQLPIATDLVMLLHYKTRKIELIDKIYSELINKFKTEVHLLMHYARFCVDVMKKRKKAHRLFRNAVALDPSNVTVLDHYAEFLASSDPQRLDAAEAVHLQSVRLNPNSAAAHFSYASFLTYVYKAPARAEVHFKTALNIDPTDSLTLCCYATFLESQADQHGPSWKLYQQTIDCTEWMHREAVKLAPTNANHGVFLANFLWRQRRHTDAWEPLHTALQLEPGNVVTLRLAATFLHDWYTTVAASGGTCEAMDSNTMAGTAEALFKRAVSLSPNDVQTLRAFAKFMDEVRHDHVTATSIDAAATQIELAEHDAAITSAENEPSDSDA